jgi:uncharacterized protein (TIGR02246 family)
MRENTNATLLARFPDRRKLAAAIVAASTVAAAFPVVATAQADAELSTTALRERVDAYQHAWATHDPTAVAAFFTADADFVMGNLPSRRGRQEIRDWWRDYFARQEPERDLTVEVSSVRFVTADVAVINVVTTTAGRDSLGEELPARRFRGTWVMRRQRGAWLIAAMQGLPTEEDRVELMATIGAAASLRPQLRAFVAAYEDTFDRHDPEALSAFYRDDADIIVRNGPVIHGAQAIREWWRAYFKQPRPYRVLLIIEEITMMADNVALLDFAVTGATSEATDQLLPVRRARATWVVVREHGEWLIAALRVLPGEDDRVIREQRR